MGGFDEDGYTGRTEDEIFGSYLNSVDDQYGNELEPYEGSFTMAMLTAFSRAVAENQEQDLEVLYDSMFIESATGEALTELARGYGVSRQPAVTATGVVTFTRESSFGESTVPSGTVVTTERPEIVRFVTTESATFQDGETTVNANVQADDGGVNGNVGADRITRMPSPPASVLSVTNPQPTGDADYTLTDESTTQRLGQDRESDDALRNRVLDGSSIGGAATVRAVRDKIRSLDGTPSLTIYTNRETTQQDGLPPLSSELVIYARGVQDDEVAQAIHDVVSITARLTSGHNGTSVQKTVASDVLDQDRPIEWSTPTEVQLDIVIDVVTTDGYEGDEHVKNEIAGYIGGTNAEAGPIAGLDVGDDVIIDELERRVNSIDGVMGIASLTVDSDGDETDDTVTRSDGLKAFEVSNDSVVTVDAMNDITVN